MQSERYARDPEYSTHVLRYLTLADPVYRNFGYCPPISKLRAANRAHSHVSITTFSIMSNNLLREHVPKDRLIPTRLPPSELSALAANLCPFSGRRELAHFGNDLGEPVGE